MVNERNDDIVRFLRCPISNQHLRRLTAEEVQKLNRKIAAIELQHLNGELVLAPLQSGLITTDKRYVYAITDGIYILLSDLAIVTEKKLITTSRLTKKKQIVRDFYDQYGWKKSGDDYHDAGEFEDLRPVVKDYIHRCHLRLGRYFLPQGRYFLDVASGPIQYPEYIEYSKGYLARVCVDFSLLALKEAKKKLGDKGVYVLADMTNLPFADNTFDGAVSLHTVYHIPAENQTEAFKEFARVLAPGRPGAVVYCWDQSALMRLFLFPQYFRRMLRGRQMASQPSNKNRPELYYQPYSYRWFASQKWPFSYQLYPWRSVSTEFTRNYVRGRFGQSLLRAAYALEEKLPSFFGRVGQYPIILIVKGKK